MFNPKFDFVCRAANDRLRRFATADACGPWNSELIDDLRSDTKFMHTADALFREIVALHSNAECDTSDGFSLETVAIDLGASIKIHFRLHSLDAPDGYGTAPAQIFVATDPTRNDCARVTLSCGLREPDGDFWYPANKRIHSVVLPDDYDWAYGRSRIYGPPTISSWMETQNRKGDKP